MRSDSDPSVSTSVERIGKASVDAVVLFGASAGGLAAPVLKAHRAGGYDGVVAFLRRVVLTVRSIMLLTGSRTVADLQRAPRVLGPALARWLPEQP